jgi:beta-xylosidase
MRILKQGILALALGLAAAVAAAGDYTNPILHADYSDPDAIRVDHTYYMTSSSFNSAPGLPLLESRDMVHWQLVGHALPQVVPPERFAHPQHGNGVWAPALRYHDGKFWIFYPDPDQGIYVITARQFRGPWSAPHLLLPGKGIIDPAPFWDEDGSAWLMHAWAKSRAGIKNRLTLRRMAPDASRLLDEQGKVVIDGDKLWNYHTLEGPKLYKRNGYYYIFAPAGGVTQGWQSVFRARSIEGPYEDRMVMAQGSSPINGPHQGAWVQAADGSDWFYHFQDKGPYGRIVHLQPMRWQDDWPLIGELKDGLGQPVLHHAQPVAGNFPAVEPATSDDFKGPALGLQWQWNANWRPEWYSLSARRGFLRLYSQYEAEARDDLWKRSSILLQKLPAERFRASTRIDLAGMAEGDSAGLVMYGTDYAWLGVKRSAGARQLVLVRCQDAMSGCAEQTLFSAPLAARSVYLAMDVAEGARTTFGFSLDGKRYTQAGPVFQAVPGRWVGAQMGLFSAAANPDARGHVDVDEFRVTVKRD